MVFCQDFRLNTVTHLVCNMTAGLKAAFEFQIGFIPLERTVHKQRFQLHLGISLTYVHKNKKIK